MTNVTLPLSGATRIIAIIGDPIAQVKSPAGVTQALVERGCATQVGTDMLFEQIPAYLEFFGFPTTTAAHLRSLARLP